MLPIINYHIAHIKGAVCVYQLHTNDTNIENKESLSNSVKPKISVNNKTYPSLDDINDAQSKETTCFLPHTDVKHHRQVSVMLDDLGLNFSKQ